MSFGKGPLVGTLRSWRDPWGFIVCPGAFQGDLFAHKDCFVGPPPEGELAGSAVQFERGQDAKGRTTAVNIRLLGAHSGASKGGRFGTAAPALAAGRGKGWQNGMSFSSQAHARPAPQQAWVQQQQPQPWQQQQQLHQQPASTKASEAVLEQLAGKRLRGEIRSWKGDWGFLVCPTKFEGDVFCHRDHLQLDSPPVAGKQVSFVIGADQKGRATATEVTEPLAGPEDFAGMGTLQGVIRSWKKDWGFIIAPESFEGDLFCHMDSLQLDWKPDRLEEVTINHHVSFEISTDRRGRACAANVIIGESIHGSSSAPSAPLLRPSGGRQVHAPVVAETVADTGAEEVWEGTLRSWRDPWGFIVSPENFQGDLFVHKESFVEEPPPGNLAGWTVHFVHACDAKGRAMADQVRVVGSPEDAIEVEAEAEAYEAEAEAYEDEAYEAEAYEAEAPAAVTAPALLTPTQPRTAPPPRRGGLLVPGGGAKVASVKAAPAGAGIEEKFAHLVGHELQGQVRSWKNDWGFIISPDNFEGDLFCHKDNIEGGGESLAAGASVTFGIGSDQRGRTTAVNVCGTNHPQDWMGTGEMLQGQVRSFKEGQPWGFIISPGNFVGDLFFHVDGFGGPRADVIRPGLEVTFRVELDKKNKPSAVDIFPLSKVKRGPPPPGVMALSAGPAKRPRF